MTYFLANTRRQIIQIFTRKVSEGLRKRGEYSPSRQQRRAAVNEYETALDLNFEYTWWIKHFSFLLFFFLKRTPDWNTWWYLTIGNSCIHERSTPRPQTQERKRCAASGNATNNDRKNSLEFHKYIHGVRVKLCICVYSLYSGPTIYFFFFFKSPSTARRSWWAR